MKVERVSANKFKITFTNEDLKDFDIDFESLRYNSSDAQDIFWSLIEQAEIEEAFFEDNAQIVVEALATKGDGLTVTVTRVAGVNKTPPKIRSQKADGRCDGLFPLIYSFDDFEKLLAACRQLNSSFVGTSNIHKMDGVYYLVINALNRDVALSADIMLLEYADEVLEGGVSEGYINEYGVTLVKDCAITALCENF